MSFDLTNKNIQDTFQNLLQKTGSDGRLYDLEGNAVRDLVIDGTLTANTYITSESIVNTSSGSTSFGNSSDDTHLFTGNITASGNISASGTIHAGDEARIKGSAGVKFELENTSGTSNHRTLQQQFVSNKLSFNRVNDGGAVSATPFIFDMYNGRFGIGTTTPGEKLEVVGNISASGHISASKFVGDGSGLTGLTSAAISSYTNNGNNRVVTSVNSTTVNSEANLTFDGTSLNVNGEITSSKVLVNTSNSTDDFFLLKSGSLDSLKVNNEGVLQLGGFTFEPTAIKGGLYYNDSDDEFYAGKNN